MTSLRSCWALISRIDLAQIRLGSWITTPNIHCWWLAVPHQLVPTKPFDISHMKWSEVRGCVRTDRTRSTPGVNGLIYKLFKKCLSVLWVLWRLPRVAWKKIQAWQRWFAMDGVHIPKEAESSVLSQFRSVYLFNVEDKAFFAALVGQFALGNWYIRLSTHQLKEQAF